MPMDLGTRNTLLCDFMHCMTAVSLEMSDEPLLEAKRACVGFELHENSLQISTNEGISCL